MKKILLSVVLILFGITTQITAQNGALTLPGTTTSYASAPDNDALDVAAGSSVTITAWVKTTATANTMFIAKRVNVGGAGYELWMSTSGYLCVNATTTGGKAIGPAAGSLYKINDGNWHHLAYVMDAAAHSSTIYVDGKLEKTNTGFTTAQANTGISNGGTLYIGMRGDTSLPLNGSIDEIRMYDKALTPAELLADMATTVTSSTVNLKAAWNCNEGTGTTLNDIKSTNNATITGTTHSWLSNIVKSDIPNIPMRDYLRENIGEDDFLPSARHDAIYTTSDAAVATVVNGKVHPVATGRCTITATVQENLFYNAATKTSTLTIAQAVVPEVSTLEAPKYYYIMSASTAYDYSGNVIYAPSSTTGVQLKHNTPEAIAALPISQDNALWAIVNDGDTLKLRNRGTGLYMSLSMNAATTPTTAFEYTANSNNTLQYLIKNNGNSYTLAHTDNNINKQSSDAGNNSTTDWYFVGPVEPSGNALNLNGSTNFMRIPHNPAFNFSNTEAFSISFWINSNLEANRNARMIAKRGPNEAATTDKSGYEILGLNTTTNFLAVNTTTGTSDNNLYSVWGTVAGAATTWTHIAYVVTGTGTDRNIIMYQNGQVTGSAKISNKDVSTFSVTNEFDVFIGKGQYDGGSGKVNGKMDNIRFWNKGLTSSEVEADRFSTVTSSTPNLIAAYDFETVDLNAMTVADIKGTHTANLEGYSALTASVEQFGMSGRGNTNDPILRATVTVSATDAVGQSITAVNLNNAILNLTDTTSLSDITSLKVYSTGTNVNFDPRDPITKGAVLLGSCSPAAGDISCTLSGTLAAGTNYLWITADIANNATEGNQIDMALKSITYNTDKTYTLTANNPTGTTNIMLARKLILAPGDAGSANYRIPAVITANDGSLLVFTDKRKYNNNDLPEDIDVVVHRSTDKGKTWSGATTIAQGTGVGAGFGDVATVKTKTGKIIALFAGGTGFVASTSSNPIKVYKSESTDNGISWSAPTDITSQLYAQGCTDPTRAAWSGLFIASGQMLYTSTGRIMAVALARTGSGTNFPNYIVYSDDDGETWNVSMSRVMQGGNEAKIMELADGTFMVTSRKGGAAGRLKATSADGLTWTDTSSNISKLVEPGCNGDFVRYSKAGESTTGNILLHSIPNNASSRRNVSVFYSTNEGTSWTLGKSIVPEMANNGFSAYSSLTVLPDGTIGAYVEVENYSKAYEMYFMNFSLSWLTGGAQTFTENRWNGTTSTDFNTAANWARGVIPEAGSDITLAPYAPSPLVISAPTTFGKVTVNAGSQIEVAAGKQLTVSTALTNNGTLTLKSDATNGTATILTPATITSGTGAVYNVQQYLTGNADNSARQWWYVSSPVSSAKSSVFDPAGTNNMGYYDETLATPAFVQFTANDQDLMVGTGYVTQLKSTGTFTFTGGTLNNGDITLTPTRTGTTAPKRGFNLVGNPYPSYLDWAAAYTDATNPAVNMRNAIWYRTYAGGAMTFHTYGDGDAVPETTSPLIAPMQGFWVKVAADNTNGSLTFKNTHRKHFETGANPLKVKALDARPRLRLVVSNGTATDEMLVVGKSYASDVLDSYDIEKMSNDNVAIPEVYSVVSNQELVINSMNALTEGKTVTLGFRPGQTGTNFTIEATQLENIDAKVMLLDKVEGTEQELTAGIPYSFEVTDATATTDRFVISLVSKMPTGIETGTASGDMTVYTNRNNRIQLIYRGELNDQTAVSVYNVAGQKLSTQKLVKAATELSGNFNPGVYMIQLTDNGKKITQKLIIK